jgi:hypothetical protein
MILVRSPIPHSLWRQGVREDEDAMVRSRQPAHIDENLFHEYMTDVFISYIRNRRQRPEFAEETAVLLMDSATTHRSERVL